MEISLQTLDEMHKQQYVGRHLAMAITKVCRHLVSGKKEEEMEQLFQNQIRSALKESELADLYASLSFNRQHVLCHSPRSSSVFQPKELIRLDGYCRINGFYADMGTTLYMGHQKPTGLIMAEDLYETALASIQTGMTLGDLGYVWEGLARDRGLMIWKEGRGHGIGNALHMDPVIPDYRGPGRGYPIVPGMVFTVEMVIAPSGTRFWEDSKGLWISDSKDIYFFEHTIGIRSDGVYLFTDPASPDLPSPQLRSIE